MFTSFFYEDSGVEICKMFLSSSSKKDKVAMVVDPPFGGLAKVLATGLNSLWEMAGKGKYYIGCTLLSPKWRLLGMKLGLQRSRLELIKANFGMDASVC